MPLYHNNKLVPFAKDLRNNMTNAERKLWYLFLKRLPLTVNRQKNIGNYIIDFYIHSHSLAIEIDGRQHKLPENREADDEIMFQGQTGTESDQKDVVSGTPVALDLRTQ